MMQSADKQSSHAAVSDLQESAGFPFVQVKTTVLHTLMPRDYEAYVNDDAEWAKLLGIMNQYFLDQIEMFPYEGRLAPGEADKIQKRRKYFFEPLKSAVLGFDLPHRYFVIQAEGIQKRFPGGHIPGQPGDGDLRDMLSALREIFAINLFGFIGLKRVLGLLVGLLVFGLFFYFIDHSGFGSGGICGALGYSCSPVMTGFATTGALTGFTVIIIYPLFFALNEIIHERYKNALVQSCLSVNNQTAIRTKNLSNLFEEIFPRIDKDRWELGADHLNEWPPRSKKWATLVFWFAKRLEYIERFVQIEMWRIRRTHYIYNRIGFVATLLLMVSLAALCMIYLVPLGYGAWAAFLAITPMVLNFIYWGTPLSIVEEKLQTENWNRYATIKLHDQIADQIFRDKQTILRNEQMLAGKN